MSAGWSEKKTCFVFGDGEIEYPGGVSVCDKDHDDTRLKSPPPVEAANRINTSAVPQSVAEWRLEEPNVYSDNSSTSDGRTASKTASLRSYGRGEGSQTPSLVSEPTTPVIHSSDFMFLKTKRKRKKRRAGQLFKRIKPEPCCSDISTTHFLMLPVEVLTPICSFCTFSDIVSFQASCVAMRRSVPIAIERLDLREIQFQRYLSVLLMRMSTAGLKLKSLVLNASIGERFCGVLGFILRTSPHIKSVEIAGCAPLFLIQEITTGCSGLKELVQVCDDGADGSAPNSGVLSTVLDSSPQLHTVCLGGYSSTTQLPSSQSCNHSLLKVLRLEGVGATSFTEYCNLPSLVGLHVFERGSPAIEHPKVILNLLWNSKELRELTVAASFKWTKPDVVTLHERCPGIQRLRLKSGSDGAEKWDQYSLPSQISAVTLSSVYELFTIKELQVEAAGWDPHWTSYDGVFGKNTLVLQSSLSVLQPVLLKQLQTNSSLHNLEVVVLYGDVSNVVVWELLRSCPFLDRLELYMLSDSTVDDDLLSPPWLQKHPETGEYSWESHISHLHLHDATSGKGLGNSLTHNVFTDVGIKFPCLRRLGIMGLKSSSSSTGTDALDSTISFISPILPQSLVQLSLGPILRTSAELLILIKNNINIRDIDLAWNGGELPLSDGEFAAALGLETLTAIARVINPALTIRDTGTGHFNILL